MKKVKLALVAILSTLLLASCASTNSDPDTRLPASEREKLSRLGDKAAIISVFGNAYMPWSDEIARDSIEANQFNIFNNTSRMTGPGFAAVNMALDDKAKKANDVEKMKKRYMTYPIVEEIGDSIFDIIKNDYNFDLIPAETVTSANSYQIMKTSSAEKTMTDLHLFEKPEKYAYLNNKNIVATGLSEEIGADYYMAIVYELERNMFFQIPFSRTGSANANASVYVTFFDKEGKIVTVAAGEGCSTKRIKVVFGQMDNNAFYDCCIEAIRNATKQCFNFVDSKFLIYDN